MHDSAMKALQDSAFILKADKVTFRRGRIAYVSSTTNFVSMEGERAVIQLAFPNLPWPGANGLGGITVDGIVTNVSVKTDQKRFRALPDERRGFGNFVVDGRNRAQSVGQQGLRNGVSHVQQQSGDAQRRAGALRPAQRVQRPLAVLRRRSGTALLDCRPEALAGLMSGSCYCKLKPGRPAPTGSLCLRRSVREADEARTGDRATGALWRIGAETDRRIARTGTARAISKSRIFRSTSASAAGHDDAFERDAPASPERTDRCGRLVAVGVQRQIYGRRSHRDARGGLFCTGRSLFCRS